MNSSFEIHFFPQVLIIVKHETVYLLLNSDNLISTLQQLIKFQIITIIHLFKIEKQFFRVIVTVN